ncbi:hypothetical protein J1N35_022493, partial [Gossypium stocksii]
RKRVCLWHWIKREMKMCVAEGKIGIYFPYLIAELCRKRIVVINLIEQSHKYKA